MIINQKPGEDLKAIVAYCKIVS